MTGPRVGRRATGPWSDLASAIATRRRLLDMTQREAADLSDLSEKALRDIESGTVAPRLGALVSIAEALGLDLALIPHSARPALPDNSLIIKRRTDPA
jgi:transcriptional regulator with XRE-family HTH domain